MKKLTLIIAFVFTVTIFCQSQVELFYDTDNQTSWQGYVPEDTVQKVYAVHFSPTGACDVLAVKFYMKKLGASEGIFGIFLWPWEGTAPGVVSVYEEPDFVVVQGWKEHPIEVGQSSFEGDFVVGYSPADPAAWLGIESGLSTGRNWVLDIPSMTWSDEAIDTYMIRAIVQYSTGVVEELEGTIISLYPNPATDVLNIDAEMKIENLTITNAMGQVVYREKVNQKSTKIDLSNFETGIYNVRTETENKMITRKIVIN